MTCVENILNGYYGRVVALWVIKSVFRTPISRKKEFFGIIIRCEFALEFSSSRNL